MCSISGWYAWGNARPSVDMVKGLLLAGSTHGGTMAGGSNDATGMAYLGANGKTKVAKASLKAEDFVKQYDDATWEEVASSRQALLHNRARTKGTINQESNHPLPYFGFVVTHNGTIGNDDDLFEYLDVKRPADVDSTAINLVLSQGKDLLDSVKQLSVLSGGCSTAFWKIEDPEHVVLARFGPNDFYLWMDTVDNILYWNSAYSASFMMRAHRLGSLRFQQVTRMPDERILLLGPEKARTFSLKRRPFTLFAAERRALRQARGLPTGDGTQPPKPTSAPPQTFLLPARAISGIHTKGVTETVPAAWVQLTTRPGIELSFKWQRRALALPIMKDKPDPMWEQMVPKWNYLGEAVSTTIGSPTHYRHITTPYGSWHLTAVAREDGKGYNVERAFKPAKRMKPYLHMALGENPRLPMDRGGAAPAHDGRLPLEYFELRERPIVGEKGAIIYRRGWMCGVCGVTGPESLWIAQENVCMWCNLQHFTSEK